jgi:tRNA 2-thiouridine synthesizing protein A
VSGAAGGLPAYDELLDERGALCPMPVIALARAFSADPVPDRVLLLADDPAAATDIPAWCSLRRRGLLWTGSTADGVPAFLVSSAPAEEPTATP